MDEVDEGLSRQGGGDEEEVPSSQVPSSPEKNPRTAGQLSVNGHVIPSPIRYQIARVQPKEKDPFFDREMMIGDKIVYVYKPIGTIPVPVSYDEVIALISVNDSGPKWKQRKGCADTFRKWINPAIPPHLALSFDQPFCFTFKPHEGRGRRRSHDLVIGYKGYCSAKCDRCPTTFLAGFKKDSLMTMLSPTAPQTVELLLQVSNECVHVKGKMYGNLCGSERKETIEDYRAKGKKPSEYLKARMESQTDSEYHSSNRANTLSRNVGYNLARESRDQHRLELGLTKCKLSNILLVQERTNEEDINERAQLGDDSTDIPGILSHVELCPTFRMYLWSKQMVQIFHWLSRTGRLILFADATGQLLGMPLVPSMDKKILHTKVSISPKYALLAARKHMRDERVSRLLSPLTVAEMVSNRNTGPDYCKFFGTFQNAVNQAHQPQSTGKPLLYLTDCSPQLQSGALEAFASEDKTLTRIEYGNIVLIHLLYYDKRMADIESGDLANSLEDIAKEIVNSLRQWFIEVFLKECKTHVYRAPPEWLKKQKAVFSGDIKSRLEEVLRLVFSKILDNNEISATIVELSVVVAMLETPTFSNVGNFDEAMQTKEYQGRQEKVAEERMARALHEFIGRESKNLHLHSLAEVRNRLTSIEAGIGKSHILLHGEIVDRARELMQNQCFVYLHEVSLNNNNPTQKVGTLKLGVVFGRSVLQDGELESWTQEGLKISVDLPFAGDKQDIKNPLYAPTVAKYLKDTWLKKVSYWSRGMVSVIENAMDMEIESSNQFSERVIRTAKHDQDVQDYLSEPAHYVLHQWKDTRLSSKQFAQQFHLLGESINSVEFRRERKKRRRLADADDGVSRTIAEGATSSAQYPLDVAGAMTQDELNQERENQADEIWSKLPPPRERDVALRNALNDVLKEEAPDATSNAAKHEYLNEFFKARNSEKFMSQATFNKFMNGTHKAQKGIKEIQRGLIQEFINEKCPGKPPAHAKSSVVAEV